MTLFLVRSTPMDRDENGGSAPTPPRAPADYLELCRRAFIKRYFSEVGEDDYEFSNNVYDGE
jgi:hypothetical protein